jgi:putative transcriptional regulator
MAKNSAADRMEKTLLALANDLHPYDIIGDATDRMITMRDPDKLREPLTGADICALRVKAHLSQAALARYLNLTVGYVSRLERGG